MMPELQLISIKIPVDMYRELQRQTKRQNKPQSAIIREAISAYLEQYGVFVDPVVSWGGYRDVEETEARTK